MEQKLVLRFSTAYEKLEKIESKVAEVRNYIKHMWGDDDEHVDTLNHVLRMLDNHHGLLLYAKENHGVDLEKILDHYYDECKGVTREQEHQMENIK